MKSSPRPFRESGQETATAITALENIAASPMGTVVINRDQQPALFFHGTRAAEDFDEFSCRGPIPNDDGYIETDDSGPDPTAYLGAHFAEERTVAAAFATRTHEWMRRRPIAASDEKPLDPRIIAVALAVANPAIFDTEEDLRSFIWANGSIEDDSLLFEIMESKYGLLEGTPEGDSWVERYESDPDLRKEVNEHAFLNRRPGIDEDESLMRQEASAFGDSARNALIKLGHDGVRYRNEVEGGVSWIAFEPEQIVRAYSARPTPQGDTACALDTARNNPAPAITALYRAQARAEENRPSPSWLDESPEAKIAKTAEGRWFTDSRDEVSWYMEHEQLSQGEIVTTNLLTAFAEQFRVSNLALKPGGKLVPDNPRAFSRRPELEFYLPAPVALAAKPEQTRHVSRPFPEPEPAVSIAVSR